MIYICAQPATFYYAWQVDTMIHSFHKNDVDLNDVHIVSAIHTKIDNHFLKVRDKWASRGVIFEFYEDTRVKPGYISSIRPHILEKHWLKYPELAKSHVFYHDCDIALTKPIPDLDIKLNSNTTYVSDTIGYIGATYIESKKNGLLQAMCDIVDIDINLVRSKQKQSGGAQYLLQPGIDVNFWKAVYKNSEELFVTISKEISIIKRSDPDWHELQIWCADMWAVLWNLWKMGLETIIHDDLTFTWATNKTESWHRNAIFHNAGVTMEHSTMPFYKGKYMRINPTIAERPSDEWASQKYYDLVVEAWNDTNSMPVVKRTDPSIVTKKF